DSTMEPLSDHLDAYDRVLAQYFGMGIMACYRGYRLYDTDETRAVVTGWVDFYRRHQAILDSDIIHVRRPDGRGLDCMMHANALLKEKGLAFIWNPTEDTVQQTFELPLYYTGLKDTARITVNTGFSESGHTAVYPLDRDYRVKVPVTIEAHGYVWVLIEE
ncbi:MAG: alpha-galactosidase, partial [Phycisphaeraceae bacterium]|nr:alpha-galactosidase [Phycisphaeraceae bacterium]